MSGTMRSVIDGVEATAAGLTTITILGALFIRPIRKWAKKGSQILDDWAGEPAREGVPARPGVMLRFQTIETNQVEAEARTAAILADFDQRLEDLQEKVGVVHHEVQPNDGKSMKDQLNRLDPEFPEVKR